MTPPLSQAAKRWLLAVLLGGVALLVVIAWLGGVGRQGGQSGPAPEPAAIEESVTAPRRPDESRVVSPRAAGQQAARAAPQTLTASTTATTEPSPTPPPPGSRWSGVRALRPLVNWARSRDGGAAASR